MTVNFECLCFLDSNQFSIIEIKLRNNSAADSKESSFKWLLISKEMLKIKELHTKSMDASHEIEERFFDLGYLKFNAKRGVFISKEPPVHHPLENAIQTLIPSRVMEAIARYLNGNNITFL